MTRALTGDVRDPAAVADALGGVSKVYHLAAQVAVDSSLDDPRADFETNTAGTLTLLDAIRRCRMRPSLVYASTHEVYGALSDIDLERQSLRYVARDPVVHRCGISEMRPLAFQSPYGCSKGAADQCVGLLEDVLRRPLARTHRPWQANDQRYYASDHHSFTRFTGWKPSLALPDGIRRLLCWLQNTGSYESSECPMPSAGALVATHRPNLAEYMTSTLQEQTVWN